jgi:hypothetical protein
LVKNVQNSQFANQLKLNSIKVILQTKRRILDVLESYEATTTKKKGKRVVKVNYPALKDGACGVICESN